MRILFIMLDLRYTKYYYETLRWLMNHGHSIHVGFFNSREPAREALHERLKEEFPDLFSCGNAPRKRSDLWNDLCVALSWGLDYLLYLAPLFKNARRLRERTESRMRPAFVWLTNRCPLARTPKGLAMLARLLRISYDSIPAGRSIKEYIGSFQPDVLLVTPLVVHGSLQSEYLKAARKLGVVSAHCVASWDNLTTKGVIKGNPDKVIVWNEVQKEETVTLHGVSPDRVVVTGAQYFDPWFTHQPSRSKGEFCRAVGLPPDRLIVLFLCSSNFMAPNEPQFVVRWIGALRNSGIPRLAEAGILIRPYPDYVDKWKAIDWNDSGYVVVWPPDGEYPQTDTGKSNFFDSIYHSFAVVGINTTAMIESAILGKCVLTVLAPELNECQTNTIHFNYLKRERGGILYLARDLKEHVKQLEEILDGGDRLRPQVETFVRNFARPHGMTAPCVPILSDAIQELNRVTPEDTHPSPVHLLLRLILYPAAFLLKIYNHARRRQSKNEKTERKRLISDANGRGGDPLEAIRAVRPKPRAETGGARPPRGFHPQERSGDDRESVA